MNVAMKSKKDLKSEPPHLPLGWRNNFYDTKRVYTIADREYELIYKEVNGCLK